MKSFILALFVIISSTQVHAQRRPTGPRYNPPGSSRPSSRPGTVIINQRPGNYGPVIVGPRYNPNPNSRRVIRTQRRPTVIWSSGFGYTCSVFGDLNLNGRLVHSFRFSSDCQQALVDIRNYSDFCDNEDLYDQSGRLEAQFTWSSECRNALGWYY